MSLYEQHVLKGKEFDAVRSAPLLSNKAIIGAGSCSILFDGEIQNSVYRLSLDSATHDFAWNARELKLLGVVYPIADYGAVAIYEESTIYPDYLHLAHLERLYPLKNFQNQFSSVSKLLMYLTEDESGSLLCTNSEKKSLISLLPSAPVEENTKLVVIAMQRLFPAYAKCADLDLSISNFMVRAETGDVVLSDPVHGLSGVSEERHERLLRETHVFEAREGSCVEIGV